MNLASRRAIAGSGGTVDPQEGKEKRVLQLTDRFGPGVVVFGFAQDSALEGDGFELPVPREMTTIFEPSCFWFL
jgi:hypothetical protein